MPAGYLIAIIEDITDPARFEEYGAATAPALDKFGAKILARRTRSTVVEGKLKGRVAVIEFPSYDKALEFYNSPEYQAAKKKREGAAKCTFLVAEGL